MALSWVTSTIVRPRSGGEHLQQRDDLIAGASSRLPAGSSASSTLGSLTSDRARHPLLLAPGQLGRMPGRPGAPGQEMASRRDISPGDRHSPAAATLAAR
jgi:hypothetical protein